ncbi:Polyisoprenoid-binding protein [Candidatus Nitrotoga sp. BS]|uniref:YceI family protein n=1 Tax=Candidatus Nitrotoga sp. BS TaxID=2890408 RepID=UPI001EF29DFA|nr:YceI family protein [Candidatus Nitrotoga sp. BS]CAH1189703.1 Polyisoprenoid-binding protein [Candidatus Nitrotoga sp. BS]
MLKQNIIAGLLLVSLPFAAHAADSYTIDSQHTFAHFSVSHLGFSTMQGRFDKSSGNITLNRAAKSGSIDVTIEAASLTTGYEKRDAHLRSPDFFNVAEFPTLTYKSNAVTFKGDTPVSVEGNLTLLGVTKPVKLTILSFKCGNHPMNKKELCGADAAAQIKRSDFGMKFGLPNVGDDIKMVFEVEAYKN